MKVPRISSKNQVTLPAAVLDDGELLLRRGAPRFERAFGALTGIYPVGYLAQLDAEDAER
jgi:hypothetical protein